MAFAKKHVAGLGNIEGIDIAADVGGAGDATELFASENIISIWTLDLE